jgi:SH3-like domain-containing protein
MSIARRSPSPIRAKGDGLRPSRNRDARRNRRRGLMAALFVVVFMAGGGIGLAWLPSMMATAPAYAQSAGSGASGAQVPRMVSLGADEVNVRTGPGIRFPVKWVFRRKLMPLEVVAEYETWRKVRDWEGAEGWVHRAMLNGRATVLVTRPEITIRRQPEATAPAVARLASGMVARLLGCDEGWCQVEVQGYEGWTPRQALWGVEPGGR